VKGILMNSEFTLRKSEGGFSLIELIIAMTITLVVLGIATTLLAQAFNVRTRAHDNVDALADAERALNIMSRELAQSGFNLSDNGIVAADSVTDGNGNSTIRVRANLNKFSLCECPGCPCASVSARNGISVDGEDAGEDVKYFIYPVAANNTTLLARYDAYNGGTYRSTVLANKLDSLHVHYFAQQVTYGTNGCDITGPSSAEVAPGAARYLVIAVCVAQNAVGAPGSPGYQPATNVLLTSDVTLRNSNLTNY
jgi:prepilin-type N-terminal cleavage/methylation domain-containing protein